MHTLSISTPDVSAGQINNPPPSGDHRGLDTHTECAHSISPINVRHGNELLSERGARTIQHAELPPLPLFDGKVEDNGNAFDRWTRKLLRYAELQHWSERDTLLQFKLYLTGRAEELYDMLPEVVKRQSESAISALGERLRPIRRDALASAQLMRRKQEPQESVDLYAHAFEQLFEKSYGHNQGMDTASKAMLKRDLFVQGLHIRWQEKVLLSADTFENALFQVRLAEQQQLDLAHLHKRQSGYLLSQSRQGARSTNPQLNPSNQAPRGAYQSPGPCYSCGQLGHKQSNCPLARPPKEATGNGRTTNAVTSTPSYANISNQQEPPLVNQPQPADAELMHMLLLYQSAEITSGAVGPLYYATVTVESTSVRALVDLGSSATIMSFQLFCKIGQAVHMPASALQKPDIQLRDYSQQPITVGACVHLTISFQDLSVTTPVYLYPDDSVHSEQCLLGTNVVIPLNLMVPHASLVPHPSNSESVSSSSTSTAKIQLVRAASVPAHTGIVIDAITDCPIQLPHNLLLFEPVEKLRESAPFHIQIVVTEQSADGHIQLFLQNTSSECQEIPSETHVTECQVYSSTPETKDNCMQITNLKATSDSESGSKLSIPERQKLLAALLHFDKDNLTNSQVNLLTDHIMSYHDVFALQDHKRGEVEKVTHAIDTQDHPPIYQPSRRIPFAQRKEMLKLVNDMMQHNVIEKSSSPWSSPVVLVKKKDGQLRFCVDYRHLNAITHKDVFPMPRIDDMLDQLSGKKVFSTLDAKSGYWQVPLEETSRSKTAFSTSNGLYQFRVVPFG